MSVWIFFSFRLWGGIVGLKALLHLERNGEDGLRNKKEDGRGEGAYAAIEDILVAGVIVDVDCDAAEGGDLGGEFIEAGVVLPRGW